MKDPVIEKYGDEYRKVCPFKLVDVASGDNLYHRNWLPEEDNLIVSDYGTLERFDFSYNINGVALTPELAKSIQADVFKWCTARLAATLFQLAILRSAKVLEVNDTSSFFSAIDEVSTGYSDETIVIIPTKQLSSLRTYGVWKDVSALASESKRCLMNHQFLYGPPIVSILRDYLTACVVYPKELGFVTTPPWFYQKGNAVQFSASCDIQYVNQVRIIKFG